MQVLGLSMLMFSLFGCRDTELCLSSAQGPRGTQQWARSPGWGVSEGGFMARNNSLEGLGELMGRGSFPRQVLECQLPGI